MTLSFINSTYNCTSITRTGVDGLKCEYITDMGDMDTVTFGGISDLTLFKVTDVEKEYTAADLPITVDPTYQLRADVDYVMIMGGHK